MLTLSRRESYVSSSTPVSGGGSAKLVDGGCSGTFLRVARLVRSIESIA
jgi:hypothetical protein